MRILLDTAALIFAAKSPDRLSRTAINAISDSGNNLEVSSISLTEIAVKVSLGKLELPAPAVRNSIVELGVRILPFGADHAYQVFALPVIHRDPFDRQIIAQALVENVPVITSDQVFRLYAGVKVIW